MMLRFREEKIQRMESLLSGLIPADTYLLQENSALSGEILLIQAKVDRNPEVTRFASENIRLLDQLRRYFLINKERLKSFYNFNIPCIVAFIDFKISMKKGREICYWLKYQNFVIRLI